MRTLTILAAGDVRSEDFDALAPLFDSVAQIPLAILPRAPLEEHKAAVNRAIDASPGGWILILRERESVDSILAAELSKAASEHPAAWGYRVRAAPFYCGRPLHVGDDRQGEIRFLHRRHCRFDLKSEGREMKVEGPVQRLRTPLRVLTFDSSAEHRAWLETTAVPHSVLRRLLLFARDAVATGAWRMRWTTLQFLWIEAAYDREGRPDGRPSITRR